MVCPSTFSLLTSPLSSPKMSDKFHYDTNLLKLQAEAMSGELRSQMVGVMPEKEQAEAIAVLRTLTISSPLFTATNMKEPTSAIILAMAKKIITVADSVAAAPESASQKTLRSLAHPSKFGVMQKCYETSKSKIPLAEASPENFADPMLHLLVTIHDEVNRPSTGPADRTQFEINADANKAKETKLKKGTDALALSNSSSSKTKGKGKEKKPKQRRAPAPVPPSIGTNSSVGAGSFGGNSQFNVNTILALLAGNSGSSSSSSSSSSRYAIRYTYLGDIRLII